MQKAYIFCTFSYILFIDRCTIDIINPYKCITMAFRGYLSFYLHKVCLYKIGSSMDAHKSKTLDGILDFIKNRPEKIEIIHASVMNQSADWRGSVGWAKNEKFLHTHTLLFVESGGMNGVAEDTSFYVGAGEAIWFLSGYRRKVKNAGACPNTRAWRVVFSIKGRNENMGVKEVFIYKRDAWPILPYMQIFRDTLLGDGAWRRQEMLALMQGLFIRFFELSSNADCNARTLDGKRRRLVVNYIIDNIKNDISPGELADIAGMSADYFCRVFKNTFNMPPKTFMVHEKLRYVANLLLESDLSIKEICHAVGEDNLSKLYRQFRAVYGVPPGKYRRFVMRETG